VRPDLDRRRGLLLAGDTLKTIMKTLTIYTVTETDPDGGDSITHFATEQAERAYCDQLILDMASPSLVAELRAAKTESERAEVWQAFRGQMEDNGRLFTRYEGELELPELYQLAEHIAANPYLLTPDQWASEARAALKNS